MFIKHCVYPRRSMDEVLFGSVCNAISPMLDTDDVTRVRVAAKCWNDGRCYGNMGAIFFQLLHSDPFVKHWYYDAEGYKLCTLRYPFMESFRKMGLQEAECSFRLTTSVTSKMETCLGRPRKGSTTFSSTRGMPNVTALIRCRMAAYLLTWAICGIMGNL